MMDTWYRGAIPHGILLPSNTTMDKGLQASGLIKKPCSELPVSTEEAHIQHIATTNGHFDLSNSLARGQVSSRRNHARKIGQLQYERDPHGNGEY